MSKTAAEFLRITEAELKKRMTTAGLFFVSKLRGFLNVDQPYTRTRSGGHRGLSPSSPGQFPKKLSGQLQRSMTWSYDPATMTLTVGSNLKGYPSFLQTGTKFMSARPWLTLGFDAVRGTLTRIIEQGR